MKIISAYAEGSENHLINIICRGSSGNLITFCYNTKRQNIYDPLHRGTGTSWFGNGWDTLGEAITFILTLDYIDGKILPPLTEDNIEEYVEAQISEGEKLAAQMAEDYENYEG